MPNGEFDGLSVDNLRAMLASADADKLTAAGTALGDAGPKILDIGSDLRHHVSRVEWTGEGGDAFREWAHDFALEVMRFGLFTTTVGKHVAQAGQTLSETKSALPASRDPRAAHEDAAAQQAASAEAEEARHQLERLSSAYRAAQQTMEAEREPEFKVLPLMVGDPELDERRYDSGSVAQHTPGAGSGVSRLPQVQEGVPIAAWNAVKEADHREATGTHIDSTTTLPKHETRAPTDGPTPPVDPPRQPSHSPMSPLPAGPDGPRNRRTAMPEAGRRMSRLPTNERAAGMGSETPRRPLAPRGPADRDVVGGQQRRPSASPRLPRGMVAGEENMPMSRSPMGGGGNPTARATGGPRAEGMPAGRRLASDPGGQVNSPRTPNPGTAGTRQRAVAIGNENGDIMRGSVPRTVVPGASGAVDTPSSRPGRGRRTASESGGTIAESRSSSRRATFTRGGTGLVSSDQAVGQTAPRPGTSGTPRRRPSSGPGRAAEDQEAWALGRRDTLPPVIE